MCQRENPARYRLEQLLQVLETREVNGGLELIDKLLKAF
jgi:hypothetical protein